MGNEKRLDFSLPFFKLHSIEVIKLFCCCYKSNLNTKGVLERYNHLLILLICSFSLDPVFRIDSIVYGRINP